MNSMVKTMVLAVVAVAIARRLPVIREII